MARRIAAYLFGIMGAISACGGSNSSGTSPGASGTGASGSGSSGSGSAVDDPTAQTDAVAGQLSLLIGSVSDGGTGASGGGGGGAGLTDFDLADFTESRTCTAGTVASAGLSMTGADGSTWQLAANTPFVTVARTYAGTQGNVTYGTNADASASGDTEMWYPGPYFGLQNITPTGDTNYGDVTGDSLPAVPSPNATAATGSSGKLGSVGWRSLDGSWTGAPVWEVGTGYVGQGLAVSQTEGMVMYLNGNLPKVTLATTSPTVGGAYAVLPMVTASGDKASNFSVLGQFGGGALPSFQTTGMALIAGAATKIDPAGSIATPGLPGKIYNPPATVTCASDKVNVAPGWRFSQNVAGLTKMVTDKTTLTRTYAKGSSVASTTGTRIATWYDPALVAPAKTAGTPYFDQNAGTLSLTRTIQIGSSAAPNTTTSVYTPTGGTANPTVTMTTYSSVPLVDTVTRNLLDPSWTWVTRTVASGTVNTTHAAGNTTPEANIATTFSDLQWTNNSDHAKACVPTSGTITNVITPVDTTKQVTTITLKFGSSVGITSASGVTSTVTCSGGSAGATNCTAAAEADDPDYKPSGCSF